MTNKKILFFLASFLLGIFCLFGISFYFLQKHKAGLEHEVYQNEIHVMQKSLASMIEAKKKSTTAIALTLASNDALSNLFRDRNKLDIKLNNLIEAYKKHTNYKNIWIHILDDKGNSLYRSWTKKNDITFNIKRRDLEYVREHQAILSDIGVDTFTLSIKSIVPIYNQKHKFIGMVEVISHFNSIAKALQKFNIKSVVIVTKDASREIKNPFTKLYLKQCYIANFDVPTTLLNYMQNENLEQFFQIPLKITDKYIIINYPLKDYDGKTVAYYVMFKKLSDISKTGLDYFVFRWLMFSVIAVMILILGVNIVFYFMLRKQKIYYKKMLDNSNNIVLVNNKKTIIDANATFFKYFPKYKSIKEFQEENRCICNFFVQESGYLSRGTSAYAWIDIVLQNREKTHKVKMQIEGKVYYFMIYVSLISQENNHYSVILSDITELELYKKELEQLSYYDTLTDAGNKRRFTERVATEITRVCRYGGPLSLIFFDIDHFKEVNDKYGHVVGDKVLCEYTHLISSKLRDVDELFRVGGEEFVILIPQTDKESAARLAEKLRKAVASYKKIVPITMSFGVTEYEVCESAESFYDRADKALYEAKESGRDRVVVK